MNKSYFVYFVAVLIALEHVSSIAQESPKLPVELADVNNERPHPTGISLQIEPLLPESRRHRSFFFAGEPVRLAITLKNNSQEKIELGRQGLDVSLDVHHSESKEKVSMLRYGKKHKKRVFLAQLDNKKVMIQPNGKFAATVLLNRHYDLTLTGSYAVIGLLNISRPKGNITIKSDEVTVDVRHAEVVGTANLNIDYDPIRIFEF